MGAENSADKELKWYAAEVQTLLYVSGNLSEWNQKILYV